MAGVFLRRLAVLVVAGCTMAALVSCGRDRQAETPVPGAATAPIDYDKTTRRSLAVPPDLTQIEVDDAPADVAAAGEEGDGVDGDGDSAATATGGAAAPVLPTVTRARLERDRGARWLVVDDTPQNIWPQLRDFWLARDITLEMEEPRIGIMETEWLINRARYQSALERYTRGLIGSAIGDDELDRYRVRLEAAAGEDGATEIYVTHRGVREVAVAQDDVAPDDRTRIRRRIPTGPNPEYEIEIMRRMLVHLGIEEQSAAAVTAAAPAAQPEERAELRSGDDGERYLALDENFTRAWRRVGLALDRSGFSIEQRDRENGVYTVKLVDTGEVARREKRSWLRRVFTREPTGQVEFVVQVRLTENAGGIEVRVFNQDGSLQLSEVETEMVDLLHRQLR